MPGAAPELVARLRAAGCVFAEEEAGLLVAAAADPAALEAMVEQRVAGRPLEQILGWAQFGGHRIAVAPGVFVPRRRTELLVELAAVPPADVIVDLCCGTGAVAVALAARLPGAEVHAADSDPAAVEVARRNLGGGVHLGDLYAALPAGLQGRVDVIVANAPYVPTDAIALMPPEARDHEARIALDGGADGLDLHRRIADGAAPWLTPAGRVVIETSVEQSERSAALFAAAGFIVQVHRSDELDGTAVVARRDS